MNKKWLLLIILVPTIIVAIIILIFRSNIRFNKLVLSESKWNSIIDNRTMSNSISLNNIKFNNYNLIVDEENSIIYYSLVNSSKKYNPSISYSINSKKSKLAISSKITSLDNDIKIMVYDNNNYHIYSLVLTDLPILNITYKKGEDEKHTKIHIDLNLFDNNIGAFGSVIKSKGQLTIMKNGTYLLSLIKESLGHNKRDNDISLFGMEKHDEYILMPKQDNITNESFNLFINSKYIGIYYLEHIKKNRQ